MNENDTNGAPRAQAMSLERRLVDGALHSIRHGGLVLALEPAARVAQAYADECLAYERMLAETAREHSAAAVAALREELAKLKEEEKRGIRDYLDLRDHADEWINRAGKAERERDEARARAEKVETHMHRMLALARSAMAGRDVNREYGGNAPEDVQGLVDEATNLHRRAEKADGLLASVQAELKTAHEGHAMLQATVLSQANRIDAGEAQLAERTRERDEAETARHEQKTRALNAECDLTKAEAEVARLKKWLRVAIEHADEVDDHEDDRPRVWDADHNGVLLRDIVEKLLAPAPASEVERG